MHRSLIAASVSAALLLPAAAGASSITSTGSAPYVSTTFQAGAGPSDVTLSPTDEWTDAAQTLTAGPGCGPGSTPGAAFCPSGSADVYFRGANDRFTNTFSFSSLRIHGAGGADRIVANGSDTHAWGDAGSDFIDVNSNSTTRGDGGTGTDELRARGNGAELTGGDGPDLLVGATPVNKLLNGDAGTDQIIDPIGSFANINGGANADTIVSLGLIASGTINIVGGEGNDTIKGSASPVEKVDAGAGADVIDVYDGNDTEDVVSCGSGKDKVYADASDTVAADCEKVVRGPAPALPAVDAALAHYAAAFPDSPQPPAL